MRNDKELAFQMRREGKSYKTISRELAIPVGTLAGWFKHEEWSHEIKNKLSLEQSLSNPNKLKLMVEANKKRWRTIHAEYRRQAIIEFPHLKDNPLFVAGLMLYWGEGTKGPTSQVKLTNSDPGMIRLFYIFLTQSLKIAPEIIKAELILYPDLIDNVQKNFWSQTTGIPLDNFIQSTYITGKHPTKRLSYGVCMIYICSRELKEKIIKWIDLYRDYVFANHIA